MSINFDLALSREVAEEIAAKPRACFFNAIQGTAYLHGKGEAVYYVEGYAALSDLHAPIEHGWIELADGTVVDPTWAELHKHYTIYSPSVRYEFAEIEALFDREDRAAGVKLPLTIYAFRDKQRGERLAAHFEAFKECLRLIVARKSYPKVIRK